MEIVLKVMKKPQEIWNRWIFPSFSLDYITIRRLLFLIAVTAFSVFSFSLPPTFITIRFYFHAAGCVYYATYRIFSWHINRLTMTIWQASL